MTLRTIVMLEVGVDKIGAREHRKAGILERLTCPPSRAHLKSERGGSFRGRIERSAEIADRVRESLQLVVIGHGDNATAAAL